MGPELKGSGKLLKMYEMDGVTTASMGPELKGSGKRSGGTYIFDSICEASMGPELKGSGKLCPFLDRGTTTSRFNGAGAEGLRKTRHYEYTTSFVLMLQWGRS